MEAFERCSGIGSVDEIDSEETRSGTVPCFQPGLWGWRDRMGDAGDVDAVRKRGSECSSSPQNQSPRRNPVDWVLVSDAQRLVPCSPW